MSDLYIENSLKITTHQVSSNRITGDKSIPNNELKTFFSQTFFIEQTILQKKSACAKENKKVSMQNQISSYNHFCIEAFPYKKIENGLRLCKKKKESHKKNNSNAQKKS